MATETRSIWGMSVTQSADSPEITLARTFAAPRTLVWQAFTEADRLARWWAPTHWTTPVCRVDLRPGGAWHYCMRGPNGEEAWAKAIYHEIVPPERLTYTDAFSDADGAIDENLPVAQTTVTLTEQDGATTLTFRTRYPTVADLERVLAMGMLEGFGQTLDRLAEELAAA